jgi:hypothetical protein
MIYSLQGFQTTDSHNGCDVERSADTLKEAKQEARYMLSDQYRINSEASCRLALVQIWKNGELIAERT